MKFEYKVFANREELLDKIFISRFRRFLLAPFFFFMGIGAIVYDTKTSINVFYIWCGAIILSYIIFILILKIGYHKYLSSFIHSSYAKTNAAAFSFIIWPCFAIPFYGFYITLKPSHLGLAILLFIIIIVNITLWRYANKIIKKNFSTLYFTINGRIFFDQQTYRGCDTIPPKYASICIWLLSFVVVQGLWLRSSHHDSGYAITMWGAFFILALALYPYIIRAIHMFFVNKHIEKRFNQRLLSDDWGFFELDPELAAKFFGPAPLKRRPVRYEEVFPAKEN